MCRVVGMDISRGVATCCILEESPPADLLEFARSYKPLKIKSSNVAELLALGDVFALEPTGSDHRIFAEILQKAGKPVLGVTGIRVRGYAKNQGLLNKADREDAAVIAAYTWQHLNAGNHKAFISITASEFREHYLSLQALKKQRTALINQVRGRLTYECPELYDTVTRNRQWAENNPPRLWRAIAGQSIKNGKGVVLPEETVGRGFSTVTEQLSQQICNLETLGYAIECECDALMQGDRFGIYRDVFERWQITENTALAILAAIYPIEQFLNDEGKKVYKRVYATEKSKRNRTTRNRSLKQFKRAIGAGRMWVQSGKKEFWVPTGDPSIRSSLYTFLSAKIVIALQPPPQVLCKRHPELKEQLDSLKSKRKKKALIQENYSLDAMLLKWMPECESEMPWKDEHLIEKTAEFTGVSDRIAELQLFYKLAPQCQNKGKTEKLMKVYPRFVTNLFRDLVEEFQETCDSELRPTELVLSLNQALSTFAS